MGQPVYASDNYGTQYTSHNREDDAGDYYVEGNYFHDGYDGEDDNSGNFWRVQYKWHVTYV